MRHQYRQISVLHNVASGTPENHLPQPVAREGTLDQEIATFRSGCVKNRLSGAAIPQLDADGLGGDPVVLQLPENVIGGRPWYFLSANDGQYRDPVGEMQQRHCKGVCARLLGTAVPMDHDVGCDLLRSRRWCQQNGPTALKQSGFDGAPVQGCRIRFQTAHDRDVERATMAANKAFIFRRDGKPSESGTLRSRASRRNVLPLHEG